MTDLDLHDDEERMTYPPLPPMVVRVDLRTVDQRQADDVAQLNLRIDNLVDATERLSTRLQRLESENATLRSVVASYGDALQTLVLRAGP